ncbi:Glucanosyltransferase, partial [Lophiotrema nucula]
ATALPTISVKGAKFFTSNGDQFYIKGVVYQPSSSDLNNLANGPQCELDASLIQELGANVVRIYTVDPTLNHDRCMKAFSDAGIYVIIDMPTPLSPNYYFNRIDPQWTIDMRNAFSQVIDGFQKYDNTLGFFVGNEVLTDVNTSNTAPYVKAALADMKTYRDFMGYREIPIGYAAAEIQEVRLQQQNYFDCGNSSIAADFYAVNRYSWCGDSSMEESGYDQLYDQADGYDIPTFLSETGCNTAEAGSRYPNRSFTDQVAMLGRQMNDRFSGNIIYEWAQDINNYGLVSYSGTAVTGTPSLFPDYTNLSKQWATLTPAGVKASEYNPSSTKRPCPASTSGTWEVKANAALPTVGTSGLTAPVSATVSEASRTGSGTSGVAENSSGASA